ncbi:response regulator, partial [Leptolyngbya sp. FACHB-36]|uniref:response regulator n=1 Tax=Leptolyngbya sp. FACHB-36 TaxID=2692808 RepID=UPI001680BBD1
MSSNAQNPLPASQDDEVIFAQEDEFPSAEEAELDPLKECWKILIVDDDVEVHEVTKLSLSDFAFENQLLSFVSAYSLREAKQLIQAHPDTAIIFLDVVMETENAGLELIQYVREELGNLAVRIILRTGQPGQAPEAVLVANYGIDDYKTKTELTSEKLFIVVVTALRAFSTMKQMLEMSQTLKLELVQYQQLESALRMSELQEREKAYQLERSLHGLQQAQQQSEQREKIETLGQWVTEVTQDIIRAPNA